MKTQFIRTTQLSKKLLEKYLGLYEIITQPSTLLFTFCLLESIYFIYLVFYISMLKLATTNTFSEKTQPTLAPVRVEDSELYLFLFLVSFLFYFPFLFLF